MYARGKQAVDLQDLEGIPPEKYLEQNCNTIVKMV